MVCMEPFLVGEKVYLRVHGEADLVEWAQWFNDPAVNVFLQHGCFPNTLTQQKTFLESMYKGKRDIQLAIVERKTNQLIGTLGLHAINFINRNGDISIVIGNKNAWGKAYGKEAVKLLLGHAFSKLNLYKVTAGMVTGNVGSNKLFLSLGFHEEARLKQQAFVHGQYQDVIKMAIFADEYHKLYSKVT